MRHQFNKKKKIKKIKQYNGDLSESDTRHVTSVSFVDIFNTIIDCTAGVVDKLTSDLPQGCWQTTVT